MKVNILKRLFTSLIDQGTDLPDKTDSFNRQVRWVNITDFLAVLSGLSLIILYSIFDFMLCWPTIVTIAAFLPFFILSIFLNRKHHFFLAKISFQVGLTSPLLTCSLLFFGKAGGLHYFFLLFSIMPVLVWSTKNYLFVYVFFGVNFLSFVFIEFFPIHSSYLVHSEYSNIIAIASVFFCAIGSLSVINFNQEQADKYEIVLVK